VEVAGTATIAAALDALEAAHPALVGTIRDRQTGARRPYMRYFAAGRDLSHEPADARLPDAVVGGDGVLQVVGAIAGGEAALTPSGRPPSRAAPSTSSSDRGR
jgi:sulfur-carrier protein